MRHVYKMMRESIIIMDYTKKYWGAEKWMADSTQHMKSKRYTKVTKEIGHWLTFVKVWKVDFQNQFTFISVRIKIELYA